MIAPPVRRPTQRLDPRTILLEFLSRMGRLASVVLIFLVIQYTQGQGDRTELVFAAVALIGVVGSLFTYFTTRYGIVGESFVFAQTWLVKSEKTIPLNRIQAVHLERGVLHRALGLAKLKIDTGGAGMSAEVELDSLSLHDAERLRTQLLGQSHDAAPVSDQALWSAKPVDLFLSGATNNAWYVVIAAPFSLLPFMRGGEEGAARNVARAFRSGENGTSPMVWFAGVGIVLLLGWLVAMARAWIAFYGFKLSESEGRLNREYGLFNRRTQSVAKRRIQSMEWKTTWLRRWLGFWEAYGYTTGMMRLAKDPADGGLLCPVVRETELRKFTNIPFPDLNWSGVRWQKAAPGSYFPMFTNALFFWGLLAGLTLGVAARFFGPHLLVHIAWAVPVAALTAWLERQSVQFSFTGRYVICQRGWRNTRLLIVALDKVQSVETEQGPLQRKVGVASLRFQMSNGPAAYLDPLPEALAHKIHLRATEWIARTGSWSPDGV